MHVELYTIKTLNRACSCDSFDELYIECYYRYLFCLVNKCCILHTISTVFVIVHTHTCMQHKSFKDHRVLT